VPKIIGIFAKNALFEIFIARITDIREWSSFFAMNLNLSLVLEKIEALNMAK